MAVEFEVSGYAFQAERLDKREHAQAESIRPQPSSRA